MLEQVQYRSVHFFADSDLCEKGVVLEVRGFRGVPTRPRYHYRIWCTIGHVENNGSNLKLGCTGVSELMISRVGSA